MKKIIILLLMLFNLNLYSKELNLMDYCYNLPKEKIRLMKYTRETENAVNKVLNRPSRKRIDEAFRKIRLTENTINHIIDEHYRELKKNDIIILMKTKLELYDTKNELFLIRKTLVK